MLDERDLKILRTVVDVHIREGTPISSQRVKDTGETRVSTATIRSSLARLERAGLLTKPHTSAGRVPTDRGYRVYVDHLDTNPGCHDTFSVRFRRELREGHSNATAVMACASRILSALSRNLAVVYGAVIPESRVNGVQLVDLGGTRLLVVLNLQPEYERTVVLRMEKQFTSDVISRAAAWINGLIADRTLVGAKQELDAAVRDNVTDEGIIAREVAVHREEIFSEPPAVELCFEERSQLMEDAELSDPGPVRLLMRLVHNREYLARILADRLGERTQITIGHEHQDQSLRPFSLVTAGYRMGGSRGVLGILGPTRMPYDLNRVLVRTAAREMRAIGEEYF